MPRVRVPVSPRNLLLLPLLAGCANPVCTPMLSAQLLFGATPGFEDFLDRSVTPRFPAGLTVLDGAGRWRAPDGRMTQEPSKLVLIVTPDRDALAKLQAIRDEFKARFRQQSVGLVLARACADF